MRFEDLKKKSVLVTGSSSGIGAATAIEFARQGCFVGVHFFATEAGAKETLDSVLKFGKGCMLKADVRDKKQVAAMVQQFAQNAGGIDILINNAGTLIGREPFETASEEFFHNVVDTNFKSVFLVSQAALPYLKKATGPSIVNIGSIAGHHGGGPGAGIYGAAKAAVATMTIAMAKEFAPKIRVNTVLPGLIETRFHELFSTAERRAKVATETPLGRNGTAQDVANVVVFLASDAAAFVTGEYIAVNGGLLMRA
jgi:3-oxoacyl-[acyl-carrier protein] reductase